MDIILQVKLCHVCFMARIDTCCFICLLNSISPGCSNDEGAAVVYTEVFNKRKREVNQKPTEMVEYGEIKMSASVNEEESPKNQGDMEMTTNQKYDTSFLTTFVETKNVRVYYSLVYVRDRTFAVWTFSLIIHKMPKCSLKVCNRDSRSSWSVII